MALLSPPLICLILCLAIGFYVVVPDFFYGDPYVPETPLSSWFRNHLPAKGAEDARKAVADLISKGASVVGVAGFCWGGMTGVDSFVVGPVRCLLYNLEGEFPVELIRLLSALSEGAWPAECVHNFLYKSVGLTTLVYPLYFVNCHHRLCRRRCTQVAKIRPDALGIDKEDSLVLEAKFVLC
ncbi:putative alpha/beta hydrolase fold protein [Tanacetum coccineum]